jgi:hypothetical protein
MSLISQGQPYQDTRGDWWIDEVIRVTTATEIVKACDELIEAQKQRNWEMATAYRAYLDENGERYYGKHRTRPIEYSPE